ncbi:MAG: hypothetical protein J6R47_04870, partial [Acholeplasmatales bacterium]|nr:hypothetical protein [Acholeplasmatales bacterium]
KRPITVVTATASKTYDGKELTAKDFMLSTETESSLLEGHSLKIKEGKAVTSVTEYTVEPVKNVLELGVYDSENNDISALYDIKYNYGNLSIDKLDITVVSGSKTEYYNGMPLSNSSFELAQGYNIPEGDELEIVEANTTITNVGTAENKIKVNVKNGDKDVSSSYNITYINGTLTINPRNITVKPNDILDFTYNGKPGEYQSGINNFELISGSLVDGEDITISVNITSHNGGTLADAGDFTVSYKDYSVVGGSKSNYNITSDGTQEFTIKPRDITVSLLSYSAVYLEDYSYDGASYSTYENVTGDIGLVGSDRLLVEASYDKTPLNVGSYGIQIKNHTFISCKSSNYIVRYQEGYHAELSITNRPITIAPKPQNSKVYSNEVYTYPENEFVIISDNYKNSNITELHNLNDWIKLDVDTFDSNYIESTIINSGNYFLKINDYQASDNVIKNYDITVSDSFVPFEITRRPITVKALDHEKTYDNTYYSYPQNDYVIVMDNNSSVHTNTLIDGSSLSIDVSYVYNLENLTSVYQAGIYDVYVKECYLSALQSNNYDVSFSNEPAKLTINKQVVEITTRLD